MPEKTESETISPIGVPSKHCSYSLIDDSCVLCGEKHVLKGRILHGRCICENCVDYITKNDGQEQE